MKTLGEFPSDVLRALVEVLDKKAPPPSVDSKKLATEEGRLELAAAAAKRELVDDIRAILKRKGPADHVL